MKILFVKTSSLGDIIQSFAALDVLKKQLPQARIDWVVEKTFCELLKAHPDIDHVIPIQVRQWKKKPFSSRKSAAQSIKELRKTRYDVVIDLQGNIKSALLVGLVRAQKKVGYTFSSAPEWPASLFLTHRFPVNLKDPMQLQYVSLVAAYLGLSKPKGLKQEKPLNLTISKEEESWIESQVSGKQSPLFMVCLGSHWENKKLSISTWKHFLRFLQQKYSPYFFFVWGTDEERLEAEELQRSIPSSSIVLPRMSLSVWQRMMERMEMVLTVDSAALHLAATTETPTFSVFGPSNSEVYKPPGIIHHAFQGPCPYGIQFQKRCPKLRTCGTGACIKDVSPEKLFKLFQLALDR